MREAPSFCSTCGGPIVPATELHRIAWETCCLSLKDGPEPREVLARIAIQLSHRLGHCAESPVCPGSSSHIGSSLVPGEVPRCPLCLNEVEVDPCGVIAGHLLGPRLALRHSMADVPGRA
jgi:hypothetical protein